VEVAAGSAGVVAADLAAVAAAVVVPAALAGAAADRSNRPSCEAAASHGEGAAQREAIGRRPAEAGAPGSDDRFVGSRELRGTPRWPGRLAARRPGEGERMKQWRATRMGRLSALLWLWAMPLTAIAAPETAPAEMQPEPRVYGYNVVDTEVRFAVDFLVRNTGANIILSSRDSAKKVSLHLDDVPLSEALTALSNQLNWYWWLEGDIYHVSDQPRRTPTPAQEMFAPELQPSMPSARPSTALTGQFSSLRKSFQDRGLDFEAITLKYRDPQEIAWLFGFSPVPPMSVRLAKYQILEQQGAMQIGWPSGTGAIGQPMTNGMAGGPGSEAPFAAAGPGGGGLGGGGLGGGGLGGGLGGAGTTPGSGILGSLLPDGSIEQLIAYQPINAIFVAGTDEGIAVLRELLALLDVKPVQMILEVMFVSVSETALRGASIGPWSIFWRELNINWAPGISTPGDLTVNWARGNFAATLVALERDSKARVLSRATVIAPNNSVVPFASFTQTPFFISTTTTGPFGQTVQSTVPVFINSGTTITIFPKINGDGTITALVTVNVNDVRGFVSSPVGGSIPILDTQTASGVFTVREGETIVLQGFTSSRRSKERSRIPLLSDIPLIGPLLFQAQSPESTDFSEKWIFFTPRVLREDEEGLPILAPPQ